MLSLLFQLVGDRSHWPWERKLAKYKLESTTHFQTCQLRIKRRGYFIWGGVDMGSGFDVELVYSKHVIKDGNILGLDGDFDLTPALARFLKLNENIIHIQARHLRSVLDDFRQNLQAEIEAKVNALTYGFLSDVYNRSNLTPSQLLSIVMEKERDLRVRQLMLGSEDAIIAAHERMQVVTRCEVTTWWYLFWVFCSRRVSRYTTLTAGFSRMTSGEEITILLGHFKHTPRISILTSLPLSRTAPCHVRLWRVFWFKGA